MYKGMLHTHLLVVGLFLLLYLIKTALLLSGKDSLLENFTSKTKWFERIVSVAFLATGIYLYINTGNKTMLLNIKVALVFASIPLAIIGFKRKNKALASIAYVFLIASYGLAEMNKKQATRVEKPNIVIAPGEMEAGQALYGAYCTSCHGENGDAGRSGASNLKLTTLSKEEKESYIRIGKGSMPGFSALSQSEINAIILYTDSFKSAP